MIGPTTVTDRTPSVYPKNGELDGPAFPLWLDETARVNHEKPLYFKLVRAGESICLGEVRARLFERGRIPDREWLKRFATAYPPNGENPVGVAETLLPDKTHFPCLDSGGNLEQFSAHFNLYANWLWLVEVRPS